MEEKKMEVEMEKIKVEMEIDKMKMEMDGGNDNDLMGKTVDGEMENG